MLHLTASGEYGTSYPDTPVNHPVRSEYPTDSEETLLIGSICGALAVMAILLWAGIWYFRNQRGTFKSTKTSTIGESYEKFVRKRPLVKYQSQSEVIKVIFYNFTLLKKLLNFENSNFLNP